MDTEFLIDENAIHTYEEIVYLLKLPQLKELAKCCHVSCLPQAAKARSEFIKLILQHFKTQKTLKFHFKQKGASELNNASQSSSVENSQTEQTVKPQFMTQCKRILGKCYKLEKNARNVFVRILMLYSLSSTHHIDPGESGQQQL